MRKVIPPTTPLSYISGYHSLNLNLYDTTGCGTKCREYWLDANRYIQLWGANQPRSTNSIFGYCGIANRTKELSKIGVACNKVFIADHYRAAVDLIFCALTNHLTIDVSVALLNRVFNSEKQKIEFFSYLIYARTSLTIPEKKYLYTWLSNHYTDLYRQWSLGFLRTNIYTICSPQEIIADNHIYT